MSRISQSHLFFIPKTFFNVLGNASSYFLQATLTALKTIPEEQKTGKQLLQPHPNWYKKNKEEKKTKEVHVQEVEEGKGKKYINSKAYYIQSRANLLLTDEMEKRHSKLDTLYYLLTCILYSIEVYNYRFQSIPSLKKYFCSNATFN